MSGDAAHVDAPAVVTLDERSTPDTPRRWTVTDAWRSSSTRWRLIALSAAVAVIALAAWSIDVPFAAAAGLVGLVPAALVDIVDHRLPDRLVAIAAVALIAVMGIESIATDATIRPVDALAGAALMAGPILVLHLVSPASMGFGDVKASIVLGAAVGLASPGLALVALLAASAGTSATGLATRRRHLPFGPGLVLGSMAALLLHGVL